MFARLLGCLIGCLATVGAHADETADQINQARTYYADGDIAGTIGELEFAIQALKGKLGTAYLETFPAAGSGWTADDAKPSDDTAAVPFLGGGTILSRTYRADSEHGTIEAQLMSGGSFMQGLASMFMSPQMLASQPGAKRIRVGKENAVVTFDPAAHSGQLMLDIAGKITIMLQGSDLTDAEPMVALANRWDLVKVKSIAGL